ncbi:uracil-DNA glycosylase [Paenibacillus turpanensis]|uniref:uracil-DNA glycosylase n=1 Tax=Paenibacillus turpanensis TaxID=2689078 RepID=UPI0014089255|nr:uracil-DNA glycosylase [Paenibacillus turpanensis]
MDLEQAGEALLWEEEPAPTEASSCTLCELSGQRKRVIWGEGSLTAPIVAVLDNPGAREDREGNPFVCGTRDTLQKGLRQAGLSEEQVYVTYLLKCRPIRAYEKETAREACRPYLDLQLGQKRPAMLLCLGDTVVKALSGDPEASVKTMRGHVHHMRGYKAVVSYHPLAVRRRPNLWGRFLEDLQLLKEKIEVKQQ